MDRLGYKDFYSRHKILVIFAIVSLFFALAYGFLQLYYTHSSLVLVKVASILFLAAMVRFYDLQDKVVNKLLITALLFHAMGDVVIELTPSFVYSIPFFAVGHIIYCGIIVKMVIANFQPTIVRVSM